MIYIKIALKDIGNASVEQLLRRLTSLEVIKTMATANDAYSGYWTDHSRRWIDRKLGRYVRYV